MKSKFESEKSQHKIDLKERAIDVVNQENSLKQKLDKFKEREDKLKERKGEIEHQVSENKAIRENLEKQLKIVAKKKDELNAANEERIRALENIAKLTEAEAREQMLEAVKAKSENEAMALKKEVLQQAALTANKEAKKIVIQSIQRCVRSLRLKIRFLFSTWNLMI